ncbi:YicC family protein [Endozoicomonas sp. G2_2]|uniref:YicC/YloC family endoribonuclease n=1 Tax=Endozoicomonas sp. G2_2 TaxID=2821092 RepID=UPI001ADAC649|nr:YicC/YloC family endoribonuclease [Endozoicomonas sp. G2_2]MBO9469717.1 YicC family protein [Endozoicomonas sp. G2_2]
MTRSMTGFARSQTQGDWGELVWELRSVNHRYLDIHLRLPEPLRALEPAIRDAISRVLSRGKVDVAAKLQTADNTQTIEIDEQRLTALADALSQVRATVIDCQAPDALRLLSYPGVQREVEPDMDAIHRDALTALNDALGQLQSMRDDEGSRLAQMLVERARHIGEHADAAAARVPQVRDSWHAKMRSRLDELDTETDPARLEQELIFTAQRMDVAEEIDRLHSHVAALESALEKSEPIGRRLDFLMQEFNREANTLGSKSQDAELTAHAVEMKVLIEQMREQVQNIE